jgi:type II secretory pathway component PulK
MVVLFFALLLTASIGTFLRRALVDAMIARNRDAAARAEALARGGVRVAQALLLQDRIQEQAGAPLADTAQDVWATLPEIEVGDARVSVRIRDSGARLNLNALFELDQAAGFRPRDEAEVFLQAFLALAIEQLDIPPAEKALYDPLELARNLLDWVDQDQERLQGGPEGDYYSRQSPPYAPANHPLMSVEELRLVEGFDPRLVEMLRPYVTVYPFAPGGCTSATVGCGLNLNTAEPFVLKALYYNDGVDFRLADDEIVRAIWEARQEGRSICTGGASSKECTPIGELVTNANSIFPPPTASAQVFEVESTARIGADGAVRRTVEAVIDRSEAANPRLLSWKVR